MINVYIYIIKFNNNKYFMKKIQVTIGRRKHEVSRSYLCYPKADSSPRPYPLPRWGILKLDNTLMTLELSMRDTSLFLPGDTYPHSD